MDNGASSYRRFRDDGDESGLVEIIRQYRDGLIFYLYSFVGNIHIAEELAEDVFVVLGTKRPKDKGTGSFKTWLYTIGRNRALNYLKHPKKNQAVSVEECAELSDDNAVLEKNMLRDERKTQLQDGDMLLVYTDGVTDAVDPEGRHFGEEQIPQELNAGSDTDTKGVIEGLSAALSRYADGAEQFDDIGMICFRYQKQ